MGKLELSLMPEWDEENIAHIGDHGIRPEQVEELYYGEGPFPTLALKGIPHTQLIALWLHERIEREKRP